MNLKSETFPLIFFTNRFSRSNQSDKAFCPITSSAVDRPARAPNSVLTSTGRFNQVHKHSEGKKSVLLTVAVSWGRTQYIRNGLPVDETVHFLLRESRAAGSEDKCFPFEGENCCRCFWLYSNRLISEINSVLIKAKQLCVCLLRLICSFLFMF